MKELNIVLFGTGKVGSRLIQQVLEVRDNLQREQQIEINIPVIANSTTAFFADENVDSSWGTDLERFGFPYNLEDVIEYVKEQGYENPVAVDATASETFVEHYPLLVRSGFHLVAANKVANTPLRSSMQN